MAEYIERESAIEQIRLAYCKDCNNYNGARCRACEFDDAMSLIEEVPAADVSEVKHGEWIKVGVGVTERIVCSQCKSEKGSFMKPPFCNQCGAKMDGKPTKGE